MARQVLLPRPKAIRPHVQEWHLFCAGEGCGERLVKCFGGLDAKTPLISATLEPGYVQGQDGIWRRQRGSRYSHVARGRAVRKAVDAFREKPYVFPREEGKEPVPGTPEHDGWSRHRLKILLHELHNFSPSKWEERVEEMIRKATTNRAPTRLDAPRGETFVVECYACGTWAELALPKATLRGD